MALSLASVQQPLHTISIPDPIARQRSLADLRNAQQETEMNALKIDSAKNQNQEWAQVRAIFDKHAGDKEGAISEVLQTPWRNKEITDTYQNEVTRMRKEAAENASLIQGKTAPEIQAAAPQTTTAPIQTSLDDSSQMSAPQASAPQTQNVPLPIKPVHLPFGPDIPVESAQQAFNRLRQTKQMESDISRDAKIAEAEATRDAKADSHVRDFIRGGHNFSLFQRPNSSTYERDLGPAEAAPQNPPQSQPALSPERFKQEKDLKAISSAVSGVSGVPLSPQGAKPAEIAAKYPPSAQVIAKSLLDYAIPWPTGIAASKPEFVQAMQLASELDSTWKASEYPTRLATMRDFKSGPTSKGITSLNTAIGHLGSMADSAKALNNTWSTDYNSLANYLADKTGDPRVKTFNQDKAAVIDEMTKAFRGTGGNEADIRRWEENLNAASSQSQFDSVIKGAVQLLSSRIAAVQDQYERTFEKPPSFSMLGPKAQATLTKLGIDPASMTGSAGTPNNPAVEAVAKQFSISYEEAEKKARSLKLIP